jgi:hypothetical protein
MLSILSFVFVVGIEGLIFSKIEGEPEALFS